MHPISRVRAVPNPADARERLRRGRPRGTFVRLPDRPGDGDLGAGPRPPRGLREGRAMGDRPRGVPVLRPRGPVRPLPRRADLPGTRPAGRHRAPRQGGDRGVDPRGEPRPAAEGRPLDVPRRLPRVRPREGVPRAEGRGPHGGRPEDRLPPATLHAPREHRRGGSRHPRVLVGHYEFPRLRDATTTNPEIVPHDFTFSRDMIPDAVDLVVFGHIHMRQVVHGKVVYPGAPERIDWGERLDPKGVLALPPPRPG